MGHELREYEEKACEMGFEREERGYHLFVGRARRITLYSATV